MRPVCQASMAFMVLGQRRFGVQPAGTLANIE